jgi:signal transduction histidine kinase
MTPVRVLLVEDSDDDAVLVVRRLRSAGLAVDYRRVETADDMAAALRTEPPDIVISDNSMPNFSAGAALKLVRESQLDVPFVVVSGEIGEEAAAALMRAGAHDFVLKGSLARLPPAVHRELREAKERQHRRQVQATLQSTEERFRLVAENLRDVVFRYRLWPDEALEYISPAVFDLTGHQPAALYDDPELVFGAVQPEDRDKVRRSWRDPPRYPITTCWRRPDGSTAWIDQRLLPVRHSPDSETDPDTDPDGVVAVEGILRDVTDAVRASQEREELARQLHQAERLDSLGQLAGGVAHDFNNLLSVICSYTAFVQEELGPDHPARQDADGIATAARQAAALTRQLLIFSRLEPSHPETLDVNSVVIDIERLLRRTIGEDIEFVIHTDPGIDSVTIDRSRLEQVIMNLVVNARAAMPNGGRLTIETSSRPIGEVHPVPLSNGASAGPTVFLTVTDTGSGMDPETKRRAFEPFYTTKGRGKGSGLGLATVYGVVTDAGGTISIWSEPDRGTRFTICLPSTGRPAAQLQPARTPTHHDGAGGHVLLVEDDPAVREVTRRILVRGGYAVTEAPTRDDAVRLLNDPRHAFALVLSDVVMPGMPAAQFIDILRATHPTTPIVLMSGYTGEGRGTGDLPADITIVSKPFDRATLLDALGQAHDRASR